jgi:hypothetical protein
MTPSSYPMGHHSYSFVSKTSQKQLKTGFDDTYFHNHLFCTQVCFMCQQVTIILWFDESLTVEDVALLL